MTKETKKENLLSSWKGIAAYLDCNVRTCLRWEKKHGLPVHRIDEKSRATVFAYKDELDAWLRKKANNRPTLFFRGVPRLIFKKGFFILLPVIGICALLIYLLFLKGLHSPLPVDFEIEGSSLVILGEEGKELWRYETGIENLKDEELYRSQYQYRRKYEGRHYLPLIMIKDINHDQKPDVLFSIQTQDELGGGDLLCFNHKGEKLWKYSGGRELVFGTKVYSNDYRIIGFDVHDLDGDGRFEVILISAQWPYFPTQITVLDEAGQELGDYWNSGRLTDFVFIDLDNDGRKDIILSGCNNEHGKGCLIAFDMKLIRGCSPQSGDYRCHELEPGTAKYYVLFPRTDVDTVTTPIDTICVIKVLKNKRLYCLSANSNIIYELNNNLEVEDVRFSHDFEQKHKELLMDGKIDSQLGEEYRENLRLGFLYYDGEKWVPEATMNRKRWK